MRRALAQMAVPPYAPVALQVMASSGNTKSAGRTGVWIFADGKVCAIAPLNTHFFDQGPDLALQNEFIQIFFQKTPVPSAADISSYSLGNLQCALSARSATQAIL